MTLPDAASLEGFSLAGLREVVGRLVGEAQRLQSDNAALRAGAEAQQATIAALRTENQALRDEVARLKGLPPRPPSRPSGMEQATQAEAADMDAKRSKPPRGVKRDRDAITAERVLKVAVPAGSRFKGYEDILVRDLRLSAEVIRYRRERWLLPSGETVVAALPAGIVGGFGPELRRFVLALHAQGQVTTERLTALLDGIGVEISKRQVVRLLAEPLDDFVAEDQDVLRAGLATARWVSVDDTAARHARKDGATTQIGDDRFTVFRTGASKSREAFLSLLRAGHTDYVVNTAALEYMCGHSLSGQVIALLDAHPAKRFADTSAWSAHLARLGLDTLEVGKVQAHEVEAQHPDPQRLVVPGQHRAGQVVETSGARLAPVTLPVRLRVVAPVPDHRTAVAGRTAHALRPAMLAHHREALGIVHQARKVDQVRCSHDGGASSREQATYSRLRPRTRPPQPRAPLSTSPPRNPTRASEVQIVR